MTHTISFPSPGFRSTTVTFSERRITVSKGGKSPRAINVGDIDTVRFSRVESPYHTHYVFEVTGNGKPLKLEYRSNQKGLHAYRSYLDAILNILDRVAKERPGFQVLIGNGFWIRLALFSLYLVMTIFGIGFATLMVGEPGGAPYMIFPSIFGIVSAYFTCLCWPWGKPKSLSVEDVRDLLANDCGLNAVT